MRGFIEELRHRNVFRVGVAYIFAGWVIAQVADLATGAFNAPEWILQMIIILLLVGLPISLFLAWAYELTPEGMKKAHEVPMDAPKDPRSGRVLNIVIIVALAVAVAWLGWDKLRSRDGITVVDKSIAVLPFDDFSPEGDHTWFADGITEEILNSLARTADLQVASRTSSFAYRDSTLEIPEIAENLGVAHILEGSVRRAGERLRVTVQLIRAADDKHLWSRNFDGSSEDSIDIQEEIAIEIAKALQTAMDPDELAEMMSAGTRSVEAWEIYLRGLALDKQIGDTLEVGRISEVIALFDRAVEIDPTFADAHLMLADLWETQVNPTSAMYVPSGLPLAERRAHFKAALVAAIENARTEATRLEAEMRSADFDLRFTDQIALARKMADLEPEKRDGWSWLNYLYMAVGEFEKSREAGLKAWAAPEEPGSGNGPIIQSMHRVSMPDALMMVDEVLSSPNPTWSEVYQSHRALLAAGENERAAVIVNRYVHLSNDPEGIALMKLRQACAEGRISDADELFEAVDPNTNARWLFLKTLGRDDEAHALLALLDTPDSLHSLASYLTYLSFEPRNYPLLWQKLTAQGINRPPARPMAYRCDR